MTRHSRRDRPPSEILQVVLDDATIDRLREVAIQRGIELEQLVVQVIHRASWQFDELFPNGLDSVVD